MNAYPNLTRVFKQAPWRVETQTVAAVSVFFVVLAALGVLYLATATRAATAGRDVQRLEIEKGKLLIEIDQLQAEAAAGMAVTRLASRARELGYVPATGEQVEYLIVPGYPAPPAAPAPPPVAVPDYDETLGSWLSQQFGSLLGEPIH